MKYLLTLHLDPVGFAALTDEQRDTVFAGHEAFQKVITESGEYVETKAVADPGDTVTVRVRNGVAEAGAGLFNPADAFLCGYYVVDCASKERAVELAALIPDAAYTGVEVRQVVHEAGPA